MLGLTIWDFILAPLYIYGVSLLAKKIKKKYAFNPKLVFYFTWGYRFKMAITLAYTILSGSLIAGDQVVLFFGEGKHFANLILENKSNLDLFFYSGSDYVDKLVNPGNEGYLTIESNYMVVKIAMILCFFTFSKFMLINIILGFISFIASWYLFLFFYQFYPNLHKQLAIATMAIPTFVFWSSGINKDTICVASLGFLTKCVFDIVTNGDKKIIKMIISILCGYLIFTIKSYILISYIPFYFLFLILFTINLAKIKYVKIILKLAIPIIFGLVILYVFNNAGDLLAQYSSENVFDSISHNQSAFNNQANVSDGSFFSIGDFDGSIGGMISLTPLALITTFFRPFFWECRNLIMLLSSLEGSAFLFLVLRIFFFKKGFITFLKSLFTEPLIVYCLGFSIVFATFVGVSTFNFGSLVRYKIPCLPFFITSLMIIHYNCKKRNLVDLHIST